MNKRNTTKIVWKGLLATCLLAALATIVYAAPTYGIWSTLWSDNAYHAIGPGIDGRYETDINAKGKHVLHFQFRNTTKHTTLEFDYEVVVHDVGSAWDDGRTVTGSVTLAPGNKFSDTAYTLWISAMRVKNVTKS